MLHHRSDVHSRMPGKGPGPFQDTGNPGREIETELVDLDDS